ncbi:MAG: hypothetical protein VX265_01615 [Myxococcota bacterium]|nr:hypothetical protein [Myxococcota bacterium]MEC8422577.1 hypothetical protein [Myxococcota bacterium]
MVAGIARRALSLGLLASTTGLAGCGKETSQDTGESLIVAGSDGDDIGVCEGTVPVVDAVSCANTGIQPHYETGEDTVTMALRVEISDEDGDLHQYRMEIFLDEEIDGTVAASDSPFGPVNQTLDVDECAGFEANVELTLYLSGLNPAYDTHYDWGVVVTDAAGYASDIAVVDCITPTEDGADGTGTAG